MAANVLRHGTGAVNVDGCRIGYEAGGSSATNPIVRLARGCRIMCGNDADPSAFRLKDEAQPMNINPAGRWPANVLHDGSEGVVSTFPANIKGQVGMVKTIGGHRFITGDTETVQQFDHGVSDEGSAARFFQTVRVPSLASDPNEEG